VISIDLEKKATARENVVYVFLDVNGRPKSLEEKGLIQEY